MEMKALLLCEESESIYVLSDVLGDLEVTLELCHDRDQALDRLLHERFEAIIVDCQVADATDMLRYVRLTGDNKNCVSLALVENLGSMQGALDNGANFVLCKPLAAEAVARTVRAMKGLIFRMGRRAIRVAVQTLAFVEIDCHAEHAIMLDLSKGGMAIQALAPVEASRVLQLRFDLPGTKKRLQISGEIAWADASGRAGIRFTDVPEQCLSALKDWIFANSVAPSRIAMPARLRERDPDSPRDFAATIQVAPDSRVSDPQHPALLSLAVENSAERIFGTCVDAVIILVATLVFGVVVFEFSATVPQSKLALPIGLLVPCLFWLAYHTIFMMDPQGTPGSQVARLGAREGGVEVMTRRRRAAHAVTLLLAALRERLGEVHGQVDSAPAVVADRVSMGPITISPIR